MIDLNLIIFTFNVVSINTLTENRDCQIGGKKRPNKNAAKKNVL